MSILIELTELTELIQQHKHTSLPLLKQLILFHPP